MHGRIIRLIDAQASWADPLGRVYARLLAAVYQPVRPLRDALNGVWLGHPVHGAVTDLPVGALTVASILDLAGERRAADVALGTSVVGMLAAAATGGADYVDTYGTTQRRATVHASVMIGSLALAGASLSLRALRPGARPAAVALSLASYAGVVAGAYVGGDLVYALGAMVDRHAWTSLGSRWRRLDIDAVPEAGLTLAHAGDVPLVLFRDGDTIRALHDTCAHAGGPLHEGTVADGCVECPWHGSRFDIVDGTVRRGPAVYDQPAFEVRTSEAGNLEARRIATR